MLGGNKRQEIHPTHMVLCSPQPCSACSRRHPCMVTAFCSVGGGGCKSASARSHSSALSHCLPRTDPAEWHFPARRHTGCSSSTHGPPQNPPRARWKELLQELEASNSLPLPFSLSSFFHFYSPSSAEPKHFGDSALRASLLFTEPPISLLQDAAWIRPITSSLDV